MTAFWIAAAVLVLLAWLVLLPALRVATAPATATAPGAHLPILREQLAALDRDLAEGRIDAAQHRLSRHEVERRVLDESQVESQQAGAAAPATAGSRTTAVAAGLAAALFAVLVYVTIGNPRGLDPQAAAAPAAPEVTPEAMNAMLATLAKRLETGTGDAASDLKGWTMLARSYAALQRFPDASRAFGRALALAPNDAQLLADQADVLGMLQNQSLKGEPDRLLARALQIDPKNLKALALAGSSAFERKDFAAARAYWTQARALAPAGSEFAAGLDSSLNDLGTAAAGGPTAVAAASAAPESPAATTAQITGRVSLAPTLAARVAPTDTVFIFARAAEGPRMPLAILKRTVADLPITFTLDDSMAMSPEMKLSKFPRVIVGVRVSRSGNAMPQPGDLRGESAPTATRAAGLQLVIDGVQP